MYRRRNRNPINGISGGIFLLSLALAFALSHTLGGFLFLPILFIGLAFSSLFRGIFSGNPRAAYGTFYGFFWLMILALFFITGSWIWFLVGAGLSAILGSLAGPIIAALIGMGIGSNQPQPAPIYQPPYQQSYQPEVPPYEPGQYEGGYQPPQQGSPYQEGGNVYTPGQVQPQQQRPYEQPATEYPQELPPQQ